MARNHFESDGGVLCGFSGSLSSATFASAWMACRCLPCSSACSKTRKALSKNLSCCLLRSRTASRAQRYLVWSCRRFRNFLCCDQVFFCCRDAMTGRSVSSAVHAETYATIQLVHKTMLPSLCFLSLCFFKVEQWLRQGWLPLLLCL